MKRIDLVYNRLLELTKDKAVTTIELASDLNLARTNVSADLNKLCEEGRAEKEGAKPVKYRGLATYSSTPFSQLDRFAERFPSLLQAVEQAKAAVFYPPNGMPILILGETGTGKSHFAELIHGFSSETNKNPRMPYVIFNCADYADNPALLLSHLFGSRKGAYTGADSDRKGLIEKADGGILFLDEIHRLPPEGQEMLFTFLDRGTYRRLGDTDTERQARVQIIAATTEAPRSALLATFVRRIPMVITIPSLKERNLDERLELIQLFYSQEAVRLNRNIHVSVNSIRSLLGYDFPNNVGQLKTDVQLLCAKAYSDVVSGKRGEIEIVTANLPAEIKNRFLNGTVHREVWNKLTEVGNRFCIFRPAELNDSSMFDRSTGKSIYEMVDIWLREIRYVGMTSDEISDILDNNFRKFFSNMCTPHRVEEGYETVLRLNDDRTAGIIEDVIAIAENRLDISFSDSLKTGIAMHLMNAIRRIKSGLAIKNPEFNRIRRKYPDEFSIAVDCIQHIDQNCGISMPIEEAGFLSLFFSFEQNSKGAEDVKPVSVVVMAHGDSTASSMAKACNDLLKTKAVIGIDVPLSEPPQAAWQRLNTWISSQPEQSDILLLVDMGSLTNIGDMAEGEFGIQCRTVSMVSTIHVLQAARRSLSGASLDKIFSDVLALRNSSDLSLRDENGKDEKTHKKIILSICSSGEGSALMVKKRLAHELSINSDHVEIISLGMSKTEQIHRQIEDLEKRGKILFVISPFQLRTAYREFSLADVYNARGISSMQKILNEEEFFEKIVEAYSEIFTSVVVEDAFSAARLLIHNIESSSSRLLMEGVKTGVLCHIACMLERIMGGKDMTPFEHRDSFIRNNGELIGIIKKQCSDLEGKFSIEISDDEICFIAVFFNPENCVSDLGADPLPSPS